MESLYGMQLIEDAYIADFHCEPVRKMTFKRWMVGKTYAVRVQKKWNKLYGEKTSRPMYVVGDRLVASPKTIQLIKRVIGDARQLGRTKTHSNFMEQMIRGVHCG